MVVGLENRSGLLDSCEGTRRAHNFSTQFLSLFNCLELRSCLQNLLKIRRQTLLYGQTDLFQSESPLFGKLVSGAYLLAPFERGLTREVNVNSKREKSSKEDCSNVSFHPCKPPTRLSLCGKFCRNVP